MIPAETDSQLQLRRPTEKMSGFGRLEYDFGVYGSGAVFTGDWLHGAPMAEVPCKTVRECILACFNMARNLDLDCIGI